MKRQLLAEMRAELVHFGVSRVASGALSFALFALITRWFPVDEAKSLYFFLFLAGFFLSAMRALATVSTGLLGHESQSRKLRKTSVAFAYVLCASVLVAPIALWLLSGLRVPMWAAGSMVLVMLLWGLDADISRAILGLRSAVAPMTALGATFAIISLSLFHSYQAALVAILLQWLPLCALNVYFAIRLRRIILRALHSIIAERDMRFWGLLALAIFDGVILNTQFFLAGQVPDEVGQDTAIVMRIFASALILLPLINYWSNSQILVRFADQLRLPIPLVYWFIALASTLFAGTGFIYFFTVLSGVWLGSEKFMALCMLLIGYITYAVSGRYHAAVSVRILFYLSVLAGLNVFMIVYALGQGMGFLSIAIVQALSLLVAAFLLSSSPQKL